MVRRNIIGGGDTDLVSVETSDGKRGDKRWQRHRWAERTSIDRANSRWSKRPAVETAEIDYAADVEATKEGERRRRRREESEESGGVVHRHSPLRR